MSLEQTTDLYASVLRQLLPEGVYDTAEMTHVADDIYGHAKALAQADIDAHLLLQVLETIPVDLLVDYEREYGLPMQCMVPGSQTIEERISVLRWIRQHRNVMNREYLEQILAIFGVTLVDVVKHYPMQCTAPCTAPVNTERLRYKVLLRLQYPMTADMSCIIENYLPGYLRVEWVVDMPWGQWVVNPDITINTAGIAHYTAYKTNQREYYDSFANLDLTEAIVRALHDVDMQKWQAVIGAVNELTGVTDSVWDTSNKRIIYKKNELNENGEPTNNPQFIYYFGRVGDATYPTVRDACQARYDNGVITTSSSRTGFSVEAVTFGQVGQNNLCKYKVYYTYLPDGENGQTYITGTINPNYNPNYVATDQYVTFQLIAQQIISNSQSSNQATSLLAEAFLETVAKSICNSDSSKQFIKLTDLIPQFEQNKVLRK